MDRRQAQDTLDSADPAAEAVVRARYDDRDSDFRGAMQCRDADVVIGREN